jgi:hypothetical protein
MRYAYSILIGKPERQRPPRIPRRQWEDDGVRIDFRETGWDSVDWIHLTQDKDHRLALVNAVMNP